MTPGRVSLKRIAHIQKSISEGFREEMMQKWALKNAWNLNVLPMGRGPSRGVKGSQQSCGDREWLSMAANGQTGYGKGKPVNLSKKE